PSLFPLTSLLFFFRSCVDPRDLPSFPTRRSSDLTDVPVPDAYRLKRVNSFDDINRIFRTLRPDVVWNAAGLQAGVYEAALAYAKHREQFGKPIAGFQLIQEKLTRMLGNAAASLGVAVRITELQERGECRDEDAALAKMWV